MTTLIGVIEQESTKYPTYSKYGKTRYLSEVASGDIGISIDFTLTDNLLEEGVLNEIIRSINVARKDAGLKVDKKIDLYMPLEFRQSYLERIRQECLVDSLSWFDEGYDHKFSCKIGEGVGMSLQIAGCDQDFLDFIEE